MEMPRPGIEHQRLEKLAGAWGGTDTIHPTQWDPKGGTAIGRIVARAALKGFYLLLDWQQERGGQTVFEGHGVLGWDPRGKCYTMHWFDSSGIEHGAPALGNWEGSVLALTHETTHMGFSRQVYDVRDQELRFRLESSPDGRDWSTFISAVYKRVERPKQA